MKQHKTNREITEENSNIPYPKIMKYRLKKDLPGLKKGTELTSRENGHYSESKGSYDLLIHEHLIKDHPEWFEPVEDRIKLDADWKDDLLHNINIEGGKGLTKEQVDGMEAYLNSETFTKEDIIDLVSSIKFDVSASRSEWDVPFNDWIENRKVSK